MSVFTLEGLRTLHLFNSQGWMSQQPQSGTEGLDNSSRAIGLQPTWESQRIWMPVKESSSNKADALTRQG